MAKPTPSVYIPLFERVLESEIGVAIETDNPKALRDELYKARDIAARPEFEEVIMFLPQGKNEVFMCRKSVELPDAR